MFSNKVECLQGHESLLRHYCSLALEKSEEPVSSIDVEASAEFINDTKQALKTVDIDVRDAKRRISSMKPKKSKRDAQQTCDSESSAESE